MILFPPDFSLTGIPAILLRPLASAGVAVFVISTIDADYLMVKGEKPAETFRALRNVAKTDC